MQRPSCDKPREDSSITRRLLSIVGVFVAIVACIVLLTRLGTGILSSVRAYVGGEGLYAKGQKDAVQYLTRYSRSHAESDFQKYRDALAIPLGDQHARLEIEKPHPDLPAVYQAFIAGRNHPEDVEGMAQLFRRFRHLPYMKRAIEIWTAGDAQIVRLRQLGDDLHDEIASGRADAARVAQILSEVDALNERLTQLEDDFSRTLGEGNRWAEHWLLRLIYVTAVILLGSGVLLSFMMLRRVKASEEALQASEARYRELAAIVESSNDAIYGQTLDGIIVSWNAAAQRLYGYSAQEVSGRSVGILIPSGHPDELPQIMERLARGERVEHFETVRVRKDGAFLDVSLTISPVRDAQGGIVGASSIARDISDRKQLERLRSEFLAMLTHDIRNPVANIAGYLELLRDAPGLTAATRDLVAQMESSVRTTVALVSNYLDRARIEAGRLALEKSPLALNALLTRVAGQYDLMAARQGITMAFDLQPDLPAVEGDALALERVFANLVHNALKFSPGGGTVTIGSRQENGGVAVSVADMGPGIAAADLPLLFAPFRQGVRRHKSGTGLGLFIAKSLIDAHGGRIDVDTTVGHGTRFEVMLPVASDAR